MKKKESLLDKGTRKLYSTVGMDKEYKAQKEEYDKVTARKEKAKSEKKGKK